MKNFINDLLKNNEIKIRVLITRDKNYNITYKEDSDYLKNSHFKN